MGVRFAVITPHPGDSGTATGVLQTQRRAEVAPGYSSVEEDLSTQDLLTEATSPPPTTNLRPG